MHATTTGAMRGVRMPGNMYGRNLDSKTFRVLNVFINNLEDLHIIIWAKF